LPLAPADPGVARNDEQYDNSPDDRISQVSRYMEWYLLVNIIGLLETFKLWMEEKVVGACSEIYSSPSPGPGSTACSSSSSPCEAQVWVGEPGGDFLLSPPGIAMIKRYLATTRDAEWEL